MRNETTMQTTDDKNDSQLVTHQASSLALDSMNVGDLVAQVRLIQEVMREVMQKDVHYGVIPGTGNKPSLLKPGAEKLGFVFRLAPRLEVIQRDLGNEHREYEVTCYLDQIHTGRCFGSGVGSCNTMEGKYRYRAEVVEGQDGQPNPVPAKYWETRDPALLGGSQFSAKKQDGKWVIAHKVEHPNPADYYNTVLKMAKKRAHVDAILTTTAASDIFTQDVEDMPEVIPQDQKKAEKSAQPVDDTPATVKLQGIAEDAKSKPGKGRDGKPDGSTLYECTMNGRYMWTKDSDTGKQLLAADGLEIIAELKPGSKPNIYQLLAVHIPQQADLKQEPDDIPF